MGKNIKIKKKKKKKPKSDKQSNRRRRFRAMDGKAGGGEREGRRERVRVSRDGVEKDSL